uniref:Uncharacterized protein n=1 Tax=Peronospora matthiolae TaxID=2874970 RepID=A0AAV1VPK6_9STRA
MRLFNHFGVFVGASTFVVTDPAASSSVSLEALRGYTKVEHVANPAETHLINGMQEDRGKSGPPLFSEELAKLAKWTGLKGESSKNKGVASVDEVLRDEVIVPVKEKLERVYTFGQGFNIAGEQEVALSRNSDAIAAPYSHASPIGESQLLAVYEHYQTFGQQLTDDQILGLLDRAATPKDVAEILCVARRFGTDKAKWVAVAEAQFDYWRIREKDASAVARDLFNVAALDSPGLEKNALWRDILEEYTKYIKT